MFGQRIPVWLTAWVFCKQSPDRAAAGSYTYPTVESHSRCWMPFRGSRNFGAQRSKLLAPHSFQPELCSNVLLCSQNATNLLHGIIWNLFSFESIQMEQSTEAWQGINFTSCQDFLGAKLWRWLIQSSDRWKPGISQTSSHATLDTLSLSGSGWIDRKSVV